MSAVQKHKNRLRNRVANMSETQLINQRNRHLKANMTSDQIINHQQNNIHANMTSQQIANHNMNNQIGNMTQDRIDRMKFKSTDQTWDWENPCPYCGCIFLMSEQKHFRKLCCRDGTWKDPNGFTLDDEP